MQTPSKPQQKSYHKGSSLYFSIGLVFSMVLVVTAFEWKTPYSLLSEKPIDIGTTPDPIIFDPIVLPEPPRPKIESENIVEVPDTTPIPHKEKEDKPTPPEPPIDVPSTPGIDPNSLLGTSAAPPEESVVETVEYAEVEALPAGGMNAFYDFLSKNINYPRQAQRIGLEGTAFVRFVVDENGNVSSAEVVEGRELGYGLDEEAIRVIKLTKWTPAMHGGRKVKQRKILPVKFKLQR